MSLESTFNSWMSLGVGTETVGYSSLVWDTHFLYVWQGVTRQALVDFESLVALWEWRPWVPGASRWQPLSCVHPQGKVSQLAPPWGTAEDL